jgi:hypothetical protein
MAPPKVGAPNRVTRNKHSVVKSTEEVVTEVEKPMKIEGIAYVEVIPSPIKELVAQKLFKRKIQSLSRWIWIQENKEKTLLKKKTPYSSCVWDHRNR